MSETRIDWFSIIVRSRSYCLRNNNFKLMHNANQLRLIKEEDNMSKMDEIIIVVPRKALFENEALTFQGTMSDESTVKRIKSNMAKNLGVMRRGDAEENENFKQPIPYAVIRRGKNELFVYERLKGGGEKRLHSKLSLGAGGHMNLGEEMSIDGVIQNNLQRELEEELDISHYVVPKTIGLINDDSTPVNRVHIALLVTLDLPEDAEVFVREADKLSGSWITLDELKQPDVYERLEDWSKIVVDTLSK